MYHSCAQEGMLQGGMHLYSPRYSYHSMLGVWCLPSVHRHSGLFLPPLRPRWRPLALPGSEILGFAQRGLGCSLKLWGSVHRPPIVLGSSFVPTLPSALGSHNSSLSTYMDKPQRHHPSFFIAACPMDHHASVL